MMNTLDIQPVGKLLEAEGLEMPNFQCINSDPATFSLLKLQPRAVLQYDNLGPRCTEESFVSKCRVALQCAKNEYTDLVLFPEYCMPYSLLKEIICDETQWPDETKLWCLPCQAISTREFFDFLDAADKKERVLVLNRACLTGRSYHPRFFVNALFYCFVVRQNNAKTLILLPQLKLHAMRDPNYMCESIGLTTGSVIYCFEGDDICLFSLLCADVYYDELSWAKLMKQAGRCSLVILHPQLNGNPREPSFSRIRKDMMSQNNPSLYITCNWAAATKLHNTSGSTPDLQIDLSWSCIYHKYDSQIPIQQLYQTAISAQVNNLNCGLFTGVMERSRTLVWFTDSHEAMHIIRLAAARASGFAVANRFQDCCAIGRYVVEHGAGFELCWTKQAYAFSLQNQLKSIPQLQYLNRPLFYTPFVKQLCAGGIPLCSGGKDQVDAFFALASAAEQHPLALDELTEIPVAWTLFLDNKDVEHANTSLNRFLKLCNCLEKHLPPHLLELDKQFRFVYLPPEADKPPANLQSTDREQRRMLVAFAEDEFSANCYLQYLKKRILGQREPDGRFVCVFYQDARSMAMKSLPRAETQITYGDSFQSGSSIINGGV